MKWFLTNLQYTKNDQREFFLAFCENLKRFEKSLPVKLKKSIYRLAIFFELLANQNVNTALLLNTERDKQKGQILKCIKRKKENTYRNLKSQQSKKCLYNLTSAVIL